MIMIGGHFSLLWQRYESNSKLNLQETLLFKLNLRIYLNICVM